MIKILFAMLISVFVYPQSGMYELTSTDLPGATFTRNDSFTGTGLWGYINGGADLYLEYGFEKVRVQEFEWHENKIKINFYKMSNPEAAFGIFSVSTYNCTEFGSLHQFSCVTQYQVQVAFGEYYLQIISDKGDSASILLKKEIAEKIIGKYEPLQFDVPELFKIEYFKLFLTNLKFINGTLGIQNGYPDWEEYFDELENYSIYILNGKGEGERFTLALVFFPLEEDVDSFKAQIVKSESQTKMWDAGNNSLIYFQADEGAHTSKIIQAVDEYLSNKKP